MSGGLGDTPMSLDHGWCGRCQWSVSAAHVPASVEARLMRLGRAATSLGPRSEHELDRLEPENFPRPGTDTYYYMERRSDEQDKYKARGWVPS